MELQCENGDCVRVTREEGTALFSRTGQEDRYMPLPKRPVGDELAEELRRLDPDQIYGEALGAVAGIPDLESRPHSRVHVWKDPALAERAGMPPMAILRAATGVSAKLLDFPEPIGRIAAGCRSRFILTEHDPLATPGPAGSDAGPVSGGAR